MKRLLEKQLSRTTVINETSSMSKRFAGVAGLISALTACCFLMLPTALASAVSSPWWEVTTGSRPTNMWEPEANVQEVQTEIGEFSGIPGAAAKIMVNGQAVGCLGTADFIGEKICQAYLFPVSATAAQFETALEPALGSDIEVTGGPVGGEPFKVRVPGRGAPTIGFLQEKFNPEPDFTTAGKFRTEVLSEGGSGRLVTILTNIGDAPLDATGTPLAIVDELPEGMEASGAEGVSGGKGSGPSVACDVKAADLVSCAFEGVLQPFDSIEVDIPVNLLGSPPVKGSPGEVTVSGGNASTVAVEQDIEVSPEETPFGIEHFKSQVEREGGKPDTRAGGHPFQLTTSIRFKSGRVRPSSDRNKRQVEQPAQPRNLRFPLPAGFIGNVASLPTCSLADFMQESSSMETANSCPDATAVGAVSISMFLEGAIGFARPTVPVFNLPPPAGEPARFGFTVANVAIYIDTEVDPDNRYRVIASVNNASQVPQVLAAVLTIWGTPGDSDHDNARGWGCVYNIGESGECTRPAALGEEPFLRLPVSCVTPMDFSVEAEPWNVPIGSVVQHGSWTGSDMNGCNQISFEPELSATPTSTRKSSSSGLNFHLDMPNNGLFDQDEIAEGQAKMVEVTMPRGATVNPSQAVGLAACTPADFARETASSLPGQGCPGASKVGSVQATTPLLEEEAKGSVYVAKPYDNPFGSLLALYVVAKIPSRGVLIKQAGKVELDPVTGQIVTVFDDLPQVPFATLDLNLFSGNKAPLVMPSQCGAYDMVTRFTPWHAFDPDNPSPEEVIETTTSFTVDQGVNGGPCPSGPPPFEPGFTAGTTNNAAGSYSPFNLRLTRGDGEEEFSRFSVKLPKGVIGKLAGIPFCSDAAIASAAARTGHNGGQEELDNPSCPAASQIGRTLVGAGVGPELSYVTGKVYLAGSYKGSKLSIVAITSTKVGPFDLGTVVIRQALRINPETAEVTSDGSSDPIPQILQGVVVHARDIRVYIDRENFVLNPTGCDRKTAAATVLSAGNQSADVSMPFQAADCSSLPFKPKLSLQLLGGTRRGDTPRLKAVLKARPGDANIGKAQVTLPHSAFLEQAHIRTVCTRVQFNAGGGNGEQCPKGSVYGKAKAITPLLDEPLQGKVYLRSSNHELPDLVAALHSSKVDVNLLGRIDSLDGRIRNTFEAVPDAPVTKFVLEMQGGKKGLIVNSTDICRGKHRALANFDGQNGKLRDLKPVVKAKCGGKKGKKRRAG
jgi:hypothetical protein